MGFDGLGAAVGVEIGGAGSTALEVEEDADAAGGTTSTAGTVLALSDDGPVGVDVFAVDLSGCTICGTATLTVGADSTTCACACA